MADIPERSAPFPACSATVRLAFDGMTFRLYTASGMRIYVAVSGKLGADFSLKAQQSRGLGVIPAGEYWIDPAQLWTAAWWEEDLSSIPLARGYLEAWGHHRLTIHPLPSTETYGRGGFFIHGGVHLGSAGCIHVTGDGMETFLADLKTALGGMPTCSVQLIVKYP
jgi:hypothetical protein